MRYPEVVLINILLASGLSLVRIRPFVWNTRVYKILFSVKLLMSQVYMLPSNPLVNSRLSFGLYSMFFTQFECPWSVRILCFKFLASQRATVLSSEQVANIRWSKNLLRKLRLKQSLRYYVTGWDRSYLTQLTQSLWAFSIVWINLRLRGSNIKIVFLSHAANNSELQKQRYER